MFLESQMSPLVIVKCKNCKVKNLARVLKFENLTLESGEIL
jgi:hypothetical protein